MQELIELRGTNCLHNQDVVNELCKNTRTSGCFSSLLRTFGVVLEYKSVSTKYS